VKPIVLSLVILAAVAACAKESAPSTPVNPSGPPVKASAPPPAPAEVKTVTLSIDGMT
jgi:hypothetical protein